MLACRVSPLSREPRRIFFLPSSHGPPTDPPSPTPAALNPVRGRAEHSLKLKGTGRRSIGPSVPVLAGPAPGEETVDFRPTSGPPSLLGGETAKTKKGPRHISPISSTKQEPIETEVSCPADLTPLLPESRPADPRTPDMLAFFLLAYAMFIGPLSPAGCPVGCSP